MSQITEEEWQKMSPEERMEYQIKNCIFCKIIKGEIPSKKVYEDDDFLGVLDVNPGTKGHVLVLPKKHVQIMPQLGTELNGKLGIVTQIISTKLKESMNAKGTSIFVANGAAAGQNAPHFMMHIFPRREDDKLSLDPEKKEVDINIINDLRVKFIKNLGLPDPAEEKVIEPKEQKEEEIQDEKKEINDDSEKIKEETPKEKDALFDKIKKMFD